MEEQQNIKILKSPIKGDVMRQYLIYTIPYFAITLDMFKYKISLYSIIITVLSSIISLIISSNLNKLYISIFLYIVYTLSVTFKDLKLFSPNLYFFCYGFIFTQLHSTQFLLVKDFSFYTHYITLVSLFINYCFMSLNINNDIKIDILLINYTLIILSLILLGSAKMCYYELNNNNSSFTYLNSLISEDYVLKVSEYKEFIISENNYNDQILYKKILSLIDLNNIYKIFDSSINYWLFLYYLSNRKLIFLTFSAIGNILEIFIPHIEYICAYLNIFNIFWEILIGGIQGYTMKKNNPIMYLFVNFILIYIISD